MRLLAALNYGSLVLGLSLCAVGYWLHPSTAATALMLAGGLFIAVSTFTSLIDGVAQERSRKRHEAEGRQ